MVAHGEVPEHRLMLVETQGTSKQRAFQLLLWCHTLAQVPLDGGPDDEPVAGTFFLGCFSGPASGVKSLAKARRVREVKEMKRVTEISTYTQDREASGLAERPYESVRVRGLGRKGEDEPTPLALRAGPEESSSRELMIFFLDSICRGLRINFLNG